MHANMFITHAQMQIISRLRRDQLGRLGASNWDEVFELADEAVHGLLHHYRRAGRTPPEVGYEIQDERGAVVAQLELAWPRRQRGIAIGDEDRAAARSCGWTVLSMGEALSRV